MRLLVLGGTRFLGRAVVDEAVRRGYDVTTFTRGLSGEPRPGAEALHGDRTSPGDLAGLAKRDWDAVIDTSVLAPVHVAASAGLLADHAGHYSYVSSLRAYRDWPRSAVDEDSPTHECPPDAAGDLPYGVLKAGSERAATQAFPGRCLLVRAGVIVGPHEMPPRLPWWLERVAAGGRVLAPGRPGDGIRLIDVRDLAAWIIDNTRRQIPGAVDIPGSDRSTFGDLLAACVQVTSAYRGGAAPELVWTAHETLLDAGVQPWWELPFWVPPIPDWAGTWQVSGERARMTGMHYRRLTDTVRDTWTWLRQEAAASGRPPADVNAAQMGATAGVGLDPARERQILAASPERPVASGQYAHPHE
jgi:2'-hydroxyisoflavone reductase